jgi:hypothetical protein
MTMLSDIKDQIKEAQDEYFKLAAQFRSQRCAKELARMRKKQREIIATLQILDAQLTPSHIEEDKRFNTLTNATIHNNESIDTVKAEQYAFLQK